MATRDKQNRSRRSGARLDRGATLERIRAIAFDLFGRHGYDGVSMGTLAEAAGLTKAALYWHYENKDALYVDCLASLQQIYRQYVFSAMESEAGPARRMLAFFAGMARLLVDPRIRGGITGYWLAPSTSDLPLAREVQERFETEATQFLTETLEAGIAAEEFRIGTDVADLSRAVIGLMQAAVLPARNLEVGELARMVGALAYTFFAAYATDAALPEAALAVAG